jgi:hypothetical protein
MLNLLISYGVVDVLGSWLIGWPLLPIFVWDFAYDFVA